MEKIKKENKIKSNQKKKRPINQIFIDMDGVIYDLNDIVRVHVNEDFHTNYPKNYNQSYWWEDYKEASRPYFELLLQSKGIFYEGNPIDSAIEYINQLYIEGYDIHILTQPQINENCYYEKAKWIQKWFPWFDLDTHFHASGNKGLFANDKRILIDDDIRHLKKWIDNNGIGICFGDYGWNKNYEKDYKNHKTNNWKQTYELIHLLCKM